MKTCRTICTSNYLQFTKKNNNNKSHKLEEQGKGSSRTVVRNISVYKTNPYTVQYHPVKGSKKPYPVQSFSNYLGMLPLHIANKNRQKFGSFFPCSSICGLLVEISISHKSVRS